MFFRVNLLELTTHNKLLLLMICSDVVVTVEVSPKPKIKNKSENKLDRVFAKANFVSPTI